jgi:hypothetical protein
MSLQKRTGKPQNVGQLTATVRLDQTRWFREIWHFLESHPSSSLLALVLKVSPDFLALPPDARARLWFWVKAELQSLVLAGTFWAAVDADGIMTYSLRPGRVFNTGGIRQSRSCLRI